MLDISLKNYYKSILSSEFNRIAVHFIYDVISLYAADFYDSDDEGNDGGALAVGESETLPVF